MDISQTPKVTPTPEKLMDSIINKHGYGFHTWKLFILVFCILSTEGFHLTFVGNMIISLKTFLQVDDTSIQFISSLCFLSVGFGSISISYITLLLNRMSIIYITLLLIAVGHITMAFVQDIVIFSIIRMIVGFSIGVCIPISLNLFTEYLPINKRSIMLTGVWLGFGFGQLFNLILMYIIMPNNEPDCFQETILASSFLSVVSFLLVVLFIRDSPRNLLLTGERDSAFLILEALGGRSLEEEEKERIVIESKCGLYNGTTKSSVFEIFNTDLRRTTILLILIWVLNSVISYGPMLISSLTMKALNQGGDEDTSVISEQITVALVYLPGTIIGGLISEIPVLGRNKTTNLSLLIAICFISLSIADSDNFPLHYAVYLFMASLAFSVNTTYSCEVYPTRVRDAALGFLFFCTRLGGFMSQIVYIHLNNIDIWLPYYVTIALCVINGIFVFLLPIDTYARALDIDIQKPIICRESINESGEF
jgi:MFS family permease